MLFLSGSLLNNVRCINSRPLEEKWNKENSINKTRVCFERSENMKHGNYFKYAK